MGDGTPGRRVVPSASRAEDGAVANVPGNYYDKHGSGNPMVRMIMDRFHGKLIDAIRTLRPDSILDVGCGEGRTTDLVCEALGVRVVGVELESVALAKRSGLQPVTFALGSAYQLPFRSSSFDLVLATEVLEHLDTPAGAVLEAARVARRACVFTVPNEPWFRGANLARGAYIAQLGNTPGHIQNWTIGTFRRFLGTMGFSSVSVHWNQIWSMAICTK